MTEEATSYKNGIEFRIEYQREEYTKDSIVFVFDIYLNSKTIIDHIVTNNAKVVFKIQTGITAFTVDSNYEGRVSIEVSNDVIKSVDTVKITAYVVATNPLAIHYSNELDEVYKQDYVISIKKNDILGISNSESFNVSRLNTDFIRIVPREDQSSKGYKIVLENDNCIQVIVGTEFNMAYSVIRNNKKELCMIFNSNFVFEIFVYALTNLIYKYEDYKDYAWYGLFEQAFLQTTEYHSFTEFIEEAKDDEQINVDVIYDVAQKMVNNQIEKTVISSGVIEE